MCLNSVFISNKQNMNNNKHDMRQAKLYTAAKNLTHDLFK